MAYPGYQNSLLLSQFREFYQELARLKAIATGATQHALPTGGDPPQSDDTWIGDIWQRILSLLETQAKRASRSGGAFGFEVYREAQYVMAALADEVFLNENWSGRHSWPLLETRLFHSHAAGELFFKRLDMILLQRDPVFLDLAAVYFFALSLGFQGRYRGDDPGNQLDYYRHKLFAILFRCNPALLERGTHLFAQSYSHILAEGKIVKLPHPRKWLLLLATILVVWLATAHILWSRVIDPIEQQLCDINPQSCAAGK